MKTLLHFIKSNFLYNKIEVAISYSLTLLILTATAYLSSFKQLKDLEDILISTAFYALLYAFYTNKKKINLRYLLSLPLSKFQLILTKSISDLVFFLPAIALAVYGVTLGNFLPFHPLVSFALFCLTALSITLILFDHDIEQPRLENSKSNFLNRLVYLKKAINFFLYSMGIVLFWIFAKKSSQDSFTWAYLLFLGSFMVFLFKLRKTLRLMQDETLSYFIPKRDLLSVGLKAGLLVLPVFLFNLSQLSPLLGTERSEVFKVMASGNRDQIRSLLDRTKNLSLTLDLYHSPHALAILQGDLELLKEIEKKQPLQEDMIFVVEKRELNLIHLAVLSNNIEIFNHLIKRFPMLVNEPEHVTLSTPLHLAIESCSNQMADSLLISGASVQSYDYLKRTPLHIAMINQCSSIAVLLLNQGAVSDVLDHDQKTPLDYTSQFSKIRYLLERKPASTKGK